MTALKDLLGLLSNAQPIYDTDDLTAAMSDLVNERDALQVELGIQLAEPIEYDAANVTRLVRLWTDGKLLGGDPHAAAILLLKMVDELSPDAQAFRAMVENRINVQFRGSRFSVSKREVFDVCQEAKTDLAAEIRLCIGMEVINHG